MARTRHGFQGWRPGAFGPVWDAMTPGERRRAFLGDLALACAGSLLAYLLA